MTDQQTAQQVVEANDAFYAAFESGDLEAMQQLWMPSGHAVCIHPGWQPVLGADAVRRSWGLVLANTPYIQFILTDVRVSLHGDVASVTCTENVLSAPEGGSEQAFAGGKAVATNVFLHRLEGWRLWIHHASPVLSNPAGQGER